MLGLLGVTGPLGADVPWAVEIDAVGGNGLRRLQLGDLIAAGVVGVDLAYVGAAAGEVVAQHEPPAGEQFRGAAAAGVDIGVVNLLVGGQGHSQGFGGGAGFLQQLADFRFGFGVFALAEMPVLDYAVLVDQVFGRPVAVGVAAPDGAGVILHYRPGYALVNGGLGYVVVEFLELEFGGVDADDYQPIGGVAGMPGLQVGQGADAVDAAVGPEIDQHNFAAQFLHGKGLAVNPFLGAGELRGAVA